MHNVMPMAMHMSKLKQEIEFQYDGRPLSETGSSFISAVFWDISSKFGTQIHFHLLRQIPYLNQYPRVYFWHYGRHLENSILRHNSPNDRPITTKFGKQMQNVISITILSSKSKQQTEFQYGGRPFSETRSSFISAVDWDILLKFRMQSLQIDFHLLKQMLSLNLQSRE